MGLVVGENQNGVSNLNDRDGNITSRIENCNNSSTAGSPLQRTLLAHSHLPPMLGAGSVYERMHKESTCGSQISCGERNECKGEMTSICKSDELCKDQSLKSSESDIKREIIGNYRSAGF